MSKLGCTENPATSLLEILGQNPLPPPPEDWPNESYYPRDGLIRPRKHMLLIVVPREGEQQVHPPGTEGRPLLLEVKDCGLENGKPFLSFDWSPGSSYAVWSGLWKIFWCSPDAIPVYLLP